VQEFPTLEDIDTRAERAAARRYSTKTHWLDSVGWQRRSCL